MLRVICKFFAEDITPIHVLSNENRWYISRIIYLKYLYLLLL